MTLLTAIDPVTNYPSVVGQPAATTWKLVRTGAKPQSWQLPVGRCTVGSSAQCQIHLTDAGIRPLHCLIVHGPLETQVTSWAPGALLNGAHFATAPLKPGDRLSFGGVELVVEGDSSHAPASKPAPQTETMFAATTTVAAPLNTPSPAPAAPLVAPRRAADVEMPTATATTSSVPPQWERDRLVRRLWSSNYNARGRCRAMIGSLRSLRAESATLGEQTQALRAQLLRAVDERERLAAELSQLQSQSDERDRQAAAELDRLISELTAAYERANDAERLRAELDAATRERDQLRQAQIQDQQNRILLSEELADRDRTIDHLSRQLTELQAASERQAAHSAQISSQVQDLELAIAAYRAERAQLAAEHAAQGEQLASLEQALAERERAIETLEDQLAAAAQTEHALQEARAEHAAHTAAFEAEIRRLHGERDDLIVDQSMRMNHLREMEQTVLARDLAIADLECQLQETRAASQAVEQNIAEYVARLEGVTSEQANQAARLHELEQTLAARDREIESLRRELDELRPQVSASEKHAARVQELESEREALTASRAELAAEIGRLREAVYQRDQQIDQLRSEAEQARASASDFEHQRTETARQLQELSAERDQLRGEQTHYGELVRELQESLAQRRREIEALERRLLEAEAKARSTDEQAARYIATIDDLHAELQQKEVLRDQLAALQTEFAERHGQLEEAVAARDEAINALTEKVAAQAEAERQAVEKVAEQAAAREALEVAIAKERADYAQTADRFRELEQAIAQHERRHADLESEYAKVCQALQAIEESSFEQIETCRTLETKLATVTEERDALAAKQLDHEGRVHEVQTALEVRNREVAELNEHLAAINERRAEAEAYAARGLEDRRLLESEIEELRARCEVTTGELTVGRVQQLEMQQTVARHVERIEALTAEVAAARQAQADAERATEQAAQDGRASQSELAAEMAELREQHRELEQSLEAECTKRKQANQEIASRNERIELLEVDLRSVQSELKQASEKLARMYQQQTAAETELATLREQLATRDAQLQELSAGDSASDDERNRLAVELESTRAEVARLEAQLAKSADDKETAHELAAQEARLIQLTAELDEARNQCDADRADLKRLQALYAESQRQLIAAHEGLRNAETALAQAASAKSAAAPPETDSAEQAIEHLRELSIWSDKGEATSAPEPPVPQPAAPAGSFQASSFIEQYGHIFDAEEPAATSSTWEDSAAKPQAEVSVALVASAQEESDDAALESYMNNLMRRVRGDTSSTPSHDEPQRVAPQPEVEEAHSWSNAAPAEVEEAHAPLDLESLRNSSYKPPLATDIKALRELANTTARRAIAKHSKARHRERAVSKLLVCGVASSVAAYMMLTAESLQSPMFLAGLVPAVVGLRWGAKFLGVLLEAIRDGRWHQHQVAEMPLEDEPLPIDVEEGR